MFKTPLNFRTVTLKLKRREVVDLMMACTALMQMDDAAPKWSELHAKLSVLLDDFDRKAV